MSWGRFTSIASGFAIAVLGLSLGLTGSAGAGTASAAAGPPAASSSLRDAVLNCLGSSQVKPGTIALACADNGTGLSYLHWTSWTPELASAYGTEWQNDCKPNCAAGHIHHYPVRAM